jgi:Fis family transcriptional regulator
MTQNAFNAAVSITDDSHLKLVQEPFSQSTLPNAQNIRDCVAVALENYFSHLDGQEVFDVYEMVLNEIEAPLFEAVMKYTRKNQTKASVMLGLNRGTLRKKLKQYDML